MKRIRQVRKAQKSNEIKKCSLFVSQVFENARWVDEFFQYFAGMMTSAVNTPYGAGTKMNICTFELNLNQWNKNSECLGY